MNINIVMFYLSFLLVHKKTSARLASESHFFALITEHENINVLTCILKVMKSQIPCSTAVSFVFSNDDVDYLVGSINNSECYSVIVRSFNDYNWLLKTNVYVIITENLQELALGMSLITIDSFWNPRAHIIAHAHNISSGEINEVFNIFVKYRTYNVIFITNEGENAEIYTYFPFENGFCGKRFDNAKFISDCNGYDNDSNLFPDKDRKNMRNCSIKVLVNHDSPNIIIETEGNIKIITGIEEKVLKNIAEIEDLIMEYEIRPRGKGVGVVLPNHTATGLLESLQNNKADIAAGGFVIMKNRVDIFDYIYGYNFATFNLYTRDLDEPIWKHLYEEFDPETWILLLSSFLFTIFVCITVLNLAPRFLYSHSALVIKLWAFFYLGNSNGSLLKVKRLRLIITCWIWFTFFISNFYTTALYSLITAYVELVRHIGPENLNSLGLKPCVSCSDRQFFQFAYNISMPENVPMPNCSHRVTALDLVASTTDLYTIAMTYSYDARESKLIDDEGNRKLDAWGFSADKSLIMPLARGFPLRDEFQAYAQRMFEGGLIKYYEDCVLHKTNSARPRATKIFRNIKFTDLKNHYLLFAFGVVLSTICFLGELFLQKRKKNTERRQKC